MGADMIVATLAVPTGTTPDFTAGRAELASLDSVELTLDDYELETLVDQCDEIHIDLHSDPEASLTSDQQRILAAKILADLERALDSRYMSMSVIGGYNVFTSGGLSYGDSPTEEADSLWRAHGLPSEVLHALGVVEDPTKPPARRNGSRGPVTDTDVVDAIALGLGTQSEWSGAEDLEWIADLIGRVRPHPGDAEPAAYLHDWKDSEACDPLEDSFLICFVDEEADHTDDHPGED